MSRSSCLEPLSGVSSRWEKIRLFEFDDPNAKQPFSKALAVEMEWEHEFALQVIEEYRKFMLLASLHPDSMVPSIHVDTVWHWHLLYTKSYRRFCQIALERDFLDHNPGSGDEEEEEHFRRLYKRTLACYENYFGAPAPQSIWGGQ